MSGRRSPTAPPTTCSGWAEQVPGESTGGPGRRVIAAVGDLLACNPTLREAEINPLRVTADGLVALDAVIITQEAADARREQ